MDILIEHPPNQKAATETKNVAYFNKTLNYNTEWMAHNGDDEYKQYIKHTPADDDGLCYRGWTFKWSRVE